MTGQPHNLLLELAFCQLLGCPIREDDCRDCVVISPPELDVGASRPRIIFGALQQHRPPESPLFKGPSLEHETWMYGKITPRRKHRQQRGKASSSPYRAGIRASTPRDPVFSGGSVGEA